MTGLDRFVARERSRKFVTRERSRREADGPARQQTGARAQAAPRVERARPPTARAGARRRQRADVDRQNRTRRQVRDRLRAAEIWKRFKFDFAGAAARSGKTDDAQRWHGHAEGTCIQNRRVPPTTSCSTDSPNDAIIASMSRRDAMLSSYAVTRMRGMPSCRTSGRACWAAARA